ncbi:MAG: hypothetical protein ACRBN8_02060 [Nannocystales bacterium]
MQTLDATVRAILHFVTIEHVPPIAEIRVEAPRPSVEPGGVESVLYGVAFVGDDVWVHRGASLWHIDGGSGAGTQVRCDMARISLFSARGQWLDFRSDDGGYLSGRLVAENDGAEVKVVRDAWLFDTRSREWHVGMWPRSCGLCLPHHTEHGEPEDSWLYDPFEGFLFDAAFSDRTWMPVMDPAGHNASLAGIPVELRTGKTRDVRPLEIPWALTENKTFPVLGPIDARDADSVEALAVDEDGRLWTVGNEHVRGPNRLEHFLAVECAPLAVVRPGFRAIAFDRAVDRIALLERTQLTVLSLNAVEGRPLVEFSFPDSPPGEDLPGPPHQDNHSQGPMPLPSEDDIPF